MAFRKMGPHLPPISPPAAPPPKKKKEKRSAPPRPLHFPPGQSQSTFVTRPCPCLLPQLGRVPGPRNPSEGRVEMKRGGSGGIDSGRTFRQRTTLFLLTGEGGSSRTRLSSSSSSSILLPRPYLVFFCPEFIPLGEKKSDWGSCRSPCPPSRP